MARSKNTGKNSNTETMPNAHLHELLVDELKDMYHAERQLLKGLEKLAKSANDEELKNAFETHHQETTSQIEKLRDIFGLLDVPVRGKKCKAMEGLLIEADEIAEEFDGSEALDAALISAAQKVEHYEIASYGCLVTYAKLMEHNDVAQLLEEILEEEKAADVKLTELAMASINEA